MDHHPGTPHDVIGANGVRLHVRDWGPADAPPLLFIHGWSGSHLGWSRQTNSALRKAFRLVAFDLRGHGFSARPETPESYQDGAAWAGDVAAVIAALQLDRPILVGWSYGGYIIGDYLRAHGANALAGIVFVGAAALSANPPRHIGPDFIATVRMTMDPDPAVMLDGLRRAVDLTTHRPASIPERERALAAMGLAYPKARVWMMMRTLDFGPDFAALTCPVLIAQGSHDRIVLPEMAEYIAAQVPSATVSRYTDCGHAPHLEASERFNAELERFARAALARQGHPA